MAQSYLHLSFVAFPPPTPTPNQVSAVVQSLEDNLELLCLTGVEDQLQVGLHGEPAASRSAWGTILEVYMLQPTVYEYCILSAVFLMQLDVRPTLELLRNAGIKVNAAASQYVVPGLFMSLLCS